MPVPVPVPDLDPDPDLDLDLDPDLDRDPDLDLDPDPDLDRDRNKTMKAMRAVWLTLLSAFGFVACSTGGGGMSDGGLLLTDVRDARAQSESSTVEDPASEDAAPRRKDSGVKTDSSSAKVCPPTCDTDSECQLACPTPNNGVNCCDVASGICYSTSSGSCGSFDAGID